MCQTDASYFILESTEIFIYTAYVLGKGSCEVSEVFEELHKEERDYGMFDGFDYDCKNSIFPPDGKGTAFCF